MVSCNLTDSWFFGNFWATLEDDWTPRSFVPMPGQYTNDRLEFNNNH